MDDLGIEDPSNLAGMSFLIDNAGAPPGFNPQELEEQITGGPRARPKRGNLAQELDKDIDQLMGGYKHVEPSLTSTFEPPTMTTGDDLDALLRDMDDEPAPEPAVTRPVPEETYSDPKLTYMTQEQRRQNVIGEVFEDMSAEYGSTPMFDASSEKMEDEKSRKLDAIESLRGILLDEGEDLGRIPNVTPASTLKEIDEVYTALNLKNDRKRCGTLAEEVIMLGAHGVEWMFDGKKSYFGRQPDMTDWHKSVQGKLRRMRHDTSNVAGQLMQSTGMSSGWRLALELLPSMFLYSRMKKTQRGDTLVSNDDYDDAISRLHDAAAPK